MSSYDVSRKMKKLSTQRKDLLIQKSSVKRQIDELSRILEGIELKIAEVDDELMNSDDIGVTEHALLRYIEGRGEIDVEAVYAEMVSDQVRATINTVRSGKMRDPVSGMIVVFKNKTIVTMYYENEEEESHE